MTREDQLPDVSTLSTPSIQTTDKVRMFRVGDKSYTATVATLSAAVSSGASGTFVCPDDGSTRTLTIRKIGGEYTLQIT